jgi:hypothetical protein
MTFIIGSSSGSSNEGSGNSSNITTSSVPVGGSPFSLSSGVSYVVPSNTTLVISLITANAGGINNSVSTSYYPVNVFINGNLVATAGPSYALSPSSSSNAVAPATVSCQLVYKAGTMITVTAVGGQNPSATLAGYTVTEEQVSTEKILNEREDASVWWNNVIPVNLDYSDTPAKVVHLGDGKALLIKNGILDKTTTVLDIETGVETAIYNGDLKFDLTDYWFIKAAHEPNYNSTGVSLTRIAFGKETADYKGGTTDYLIELKNTPASSSADSDFIVKLLSTCIYGGINSGRVFSSSYPNLILGFAGIDYLITADLTFGTSNNNTHNFITPTNIKSHNISVNPTVTTTIATQFGLIPSYKVFSSDTDNFCRAKAIRGNGGRLYVYLHSSNTTNNNSASYYGYQVLVINPNGTLLAQANATNQTMMPGYTTYKFGSSQGTASLTSALAYPASIALSQQANGSEKLLALILSRRSVDLLFGATYTYMDVRSQQFSFVGGTPAVVSGISNQTVSFEPISGVTDSALSHPIFASNPEAPTATKLGSYFNKLTDFSGVDITISTPNSPIYPNMLQSSPSQHMRTNGVFHGNQHGWFYPTGLFVEHRQYGNFGQLNSTSSVVPTKIINPVQAITSTSKLLIVDVNGRWERVSTQ